MALREEARSALPKLKAVAEYKAGEDGVRARGHRDATIHPSRCCQWYR